MEEDDRTQNDLPTENRQITTFTSPVISTRRPIQATTSIYYSQTPYTIPRGLPRNSNSLSNFVLTHYRPYRRRSDFIAHPYVLTWCYRIHLCSQDQHTFSRDPATRHMATGSPIGLYRRHAIQKYPQHVYFQPRFPLMPFQTSYRRSSAALGIR